MMYLLNLRIGWKVSLTESSTLSWEVIYSCYRRWKTLGVFGLSYDGVVGESESNLDAAVEETKVVAKSLLGATSGKVRYSMDIQWSVAIPGLRALSCSPYSGIQKRVGESL